MVLASSMVLLSYFGLAASHHVEWDDYHWGQHHEDARNHPSANEYHQQDQQNPEYRQQNRGIQGQFHQDQRNGDSHQPAHQNDQFQGYPIHRPSPPPSTMTPSMSTVPPTPQITPVPNSVPNDIPKHRILLRHLFQQVLGPNFTGPGVQQLAFLSSLPSLPLISQVQDYPQQQTAETQYDLPQYIEPPPLPQSDQFNYYS